MSDPLPARAEVLRTPHEIFNPGVGVKYRNPRSNDTFYPINVNNWYGYAGRDGQILIFPSFDWTDYFYDDLARAVVDGRTGFIDTLGGWAVEPRFAVADRFRQNMAVVREGENFGFINQRGRLVVSAQYDGALRFRDGLAAVRVGQRCGFINKRGRLVIGLHFARVRSFHENLAMVQLPPESGRPDGTGVLAYIDQTGSARFVDRDRSFEDLGDFHQTLARARAGDLWGYIDKTFVFRIAPRFEAAEDFSEDLAAVRFEGRFGYIDRRGRWVIEPRLESAQDVTEGIALVGLDGRFGFVDRSGRLRTPIVFEFAEPFFRGLGRVEVAPNFGYVDVSGRAAWNPRDPFVHVWDRTLGGRARLKAERLSRRRSGARLAPFRTERGVVRGGRLEIEPPPPRAPLPRPYLPDHLYRDELPRERHRGTKALRHEAIRLWRTTKGGKAGYVIMSRRVGGLGMGRAPHSPCSPLPLREGLGVCISLNFRSDNSR